MPLWFLLYETLWPLVVAVVFDLLLLCRFWLA
jgi:hypothetical protein